MKMTTIKNIGEREAGPPDWLSAGRIPSLDGLRAVAVLLVVFAHASRTRGFPDAPWLHAVGHRAAVGVEVFFIISGLLITTLMLREIDRSARLGIKDFYIRRVLRIVPAYACFLGVVAILARLGQVRLGSSDWLASITYTVNFLERPAWEIGHAWSLSIEEHFYLLWPLALALGGVTFARNSAVAIVAMCFVARWAIIFRFPKSIQMAELWTFTRLDSIAFGCLLAFLARDEAWRGRLDRLCSRGWIMALAFVGLLGSLGLSSLSGKFSVGLAYTINAALLSLLIWSAVRRRHSAIGRALNHRALAAIGVGSYSIYLWQQIFTNRENPSPISGFPQNVFFAFAAAYVSYRFVEQPFLALKDRINVGRGPFVRDTAGPRVLARAGEVAG